MHAIESDIMADGYLSEESDFYGDEETVKKWEKKSKAFDIRDLWKSLGRGPNVVYAPKAAEAKPTIPKGGLHNRYEGVDSAWQLHETVDDFLARLPVHSSSWAGLWLWVANPYADRDAEPEYQSAKFKQQGPKLLQDYLDYRQQMEQENPDKIPAVITRKLYPARIKFKEDIINLSKDSGMLCGKWMLFPYEDDATSVWKRVVAGVIEGKLGTAAKIATDDEGKGTRLICVYTRDFSDVEDVKRVVQQLQKMGLLPTEGRSIYYKSDAYTYLNIYSENKYNLQASLYASKDVLEGKVDSNTTAKTAGQKRIGDFTANSKADGKRKKT